MLSTENGGWDVNRSDGERASAHTETKKDAVNIARTISQSQIVISNKDEVLEAVCAG